MQGTENEERMRIRRARPADVPRVLQYVREHATNTWRGVFRPPPANNIVLSDYITRALSQGHSMLAELHESRRSWSHIRGLAIGIAVCPWDATMLERWARCIKCTQSRRLLLFNAHCLRAPALHSKYGVNRILQVVLIVPESCTNNKDIVQMLARNIIQRGREVGFSVLRFDVTNSVVAKALEELNLKREWGLSYEVPNIVNDYEENQETAENETVNSETKANKDKELRNYQIAVYTSIHNNRQSNKE